MTGMRTEKSFCRICGGICAVDVSIENGRIVKVRGDKSDPFTRGFTCFKGLQAPEQHHGRTRLRHSLKRTAHGGHERIGSETALREVASRLRRILDDHGPDAIALYTGTQAFMSTFGRPFARALLEGIGSTNNYSTMTIDQSAKWIADARIGTMASGRQPFQGSDVFMAIGTNPLVSLLGGPGLSGFAAQDPVKTLKEEKARGLKLIVIDPRRTETAAFADLFLQPRAGVDAILIAGIVHVVLREGWQDGQFCSDHVDGLEDLRAALGSFTPDVVAEATDVPAADIVLAARMFAHEAKRGIAGTGTGTDMGPHSNLAEHLVQALNVVCGRFQRAGDRVLNPGVLQPQPDRFEEVVPPRREWQAGPRSRRHGLGQLKGQMMTARLADEILGDDPGRIRALICIGGNPAIALPDEARTARALDRLDLLVTVDPQMTRTGAHAHYVIAPKVQYERADHTGAMEFLLDAPYAHYTPALIEPEDDMDVVDEWYALWRIAREMGVPLTIEGTAIDMAEPPTVEGLIPIMIPRPRVPLETIRAQRGGRLYPAPKKILPARPEAGAARLQLLADDVAAELDGLREELRAAPSRTDDFPYSLTVRREREVMNSMLTNFDGVAARKPHAPAYLHPDEMSRRRLAPGDTVRIRSEHGAIEASVVADDTLRRDVVQMTHCWPGGSLTEDAGRTTANLVDSDRAPAAINHMPVMTAIPVAIERA